MTIHSWYDSLITALKDGENVVRVVLIRAEGSTPREMGADMMIYSDHFTGTIGGGTLEHEVITTARQLMTSPRTNYRAKRQYPLGPTLGQCCGGFVEVMFEHVIPEDLSLWKAFKTTSSIFHPNEPDLPPTHNPAHKDGVSFRIHADRTPLYLYGAGHVGRALMAITGSLPFTRFWIDTDATRFPDTIPDDIETVIASTPAQIATYAQDDAIHLVMSYSHQLDLDICLAVLQKASFFRLGLIGSTTKKARFLKSLKNAGIDDHSLKKLVCPIGLPEIGGKDPARVALSIAGHLSEWTREDNLLHDAADTA